MHFRTFALGAIVACLPVLVLACGDGADGDSNPTAAAGGTTAPASATSVDAGPAAGFTPVAFDTADVEYAAKVCVAFDTYADDISGMLAKDPELSSDISKLLDEMAPILETLQQSIRDAEPTDAVKGFHDSTDESVTTLLHAVREKRIEDITDFSTALGVAAPPKDSQDRVRSAAMAAPDCEGNELFFAPPPADG